MDFKSLYPNLIRVFNLSYETVDLKVEYLRERKFLYGYTGTDTKVDEIDDSIESYSFSRKGDKLQLVFNDKILHIRAYVTIDMSRRGLVPRMLDEAMIKRDEIRKEMKNMDPTSVEYKKANSLQLFYKIVYNSTYGMLSQRNSIGFMPVGMTTTAMGRWLTKNVGNAINDESLDLVEISA